MKALFILPFTVFSFFFVAAQAPVNDDCAGLVDLGEVPYCAQPAQFSNVNATTSNIDPTANVPACWNNLGDRDVWFQFSLPANGSITDVSIDVWGNIAGNGTLKMPQLAVYRGDCVFGGLAELACIAAPLNVNEVHLDLFGLTPGVPYFLRINDYSATASPNSGTFKLCVEPYVPDIYMGDQAGTASCSGTLWDSGGPDGDYQSDENETFVICPSEFHQCLKINLLSYATEETYDFIRIYEGNGTGGNLLETIDGFGTNLEIQSPADCITIEFESDGSVEEAGFQLSWQCSADVCDAPPPTLPSNATCDQAISINGCDNTLHTIPLSPGAGDPNFLQDGVNQGCFDLSILNTFNQSFFYFQAAADGKFGFAVESANPSEASDIDFNVWGPINSIAEICDFVSSKQPIRSSWAADPDLTGLADIHPVLGTAINDNFDCGSPITPGPNPPFPFGVADDFVRRIDVQSGQIYVIMLDDFGGNIQQNGISIDFSGTSEDVLGMITTPITISNDTFFCTGSPVQLQVTGGVSYAWTPSTGLSCNTCPNPFASPTMTTTYEVKVADVCQTFIGNITVSEGPSVDVQNDTAICNGQSVVLGQTVPQSGVTYSWTPNDGSLSDPNAANPIATPLQTTVYTLMASNGPCTTTRVVTVAVVNLDLQLSVQDTALCRGQSLEITATVNPSGTPINWTPLTQLQVQPGGGTALASPKTDIVYTVSASLPGCMRKETLSILVDSLPANLSIAPIDTLVCAGTQVLLVSPAYSGALYPDLQFVWQTTSGQIFPDSQYFFLANPSQSTVYQRITTKGACVDTASATINVIQVPILTITPANPQLCLGESTPLVVSNTAGLTNLLWTPPVGLSCIVCTNPTAAPSTTTTYQFTADVANGCTTTASVTVEVNQQPQFQFPNDTLCAGESILLNLIADSTVSYSWTSNPPGFLSSDAQPTDTPAQTTTYLVTMENGCTVQRQFVIPVIPAGTLMLSDSATVCAGISAQLTASGNYPGTYLWSNGATGQVIPVVPTQTTTYTVTYSYPLPNVQCQIIDSVTVGVQGEVAQVQFPLDILLCPGDSVLLNSASTPGATYTWSSNPPIFTSNDPIPPVFYPEESATYAVTTTLGNCTVTYAVEVIVFNPQMTVSEDTTICAGEPVTITAEALLTGDYLWTPGGILPTFVDTVTANIQYTLRFEYGEGCVYEDTVNVMVIPSFTLKLFSDPDTNRINVGEPIMLDAFVPGTNVSNFIFEWLENNSDPVGNTQKITVIPETTDSTVTYFVTVVSPAGCVQSASITFTIVQPNIKIPNAFTPNGDGANDSFGLAFVEGVATVEKMEIYTRWGQKIFASTDPNARWDGAIGDKDAPSDVYVYIIFWRGGDGALKVDRGDVTLLR
ncbi:MAG: gliding motility-associated C-terminal domain-containing protein [Saprospiraceae bacterium]|nr:gliding motility-associated C-terminal domain-containing protein [Saprospiraceae bacterium]